jgi:hypothetical protein
LSELSKQTYRETYPGDFTEEQIEEYYGLKELAIHIIL